jgi:hypothetical protein
MKEKLQSSTRHPNEIAWETGFAALKEFKSREGHCRVPRKYEEGSFKLGTWVVNQRNRRNNLSTERRQRLDSIGFVWAFQTLPWEAGFAALKEFKSREGHCRVPRRHEVGNFKLGDWVRRQRTEKNTMSTGCRRQLAAIGFVWDTYEDKWEKNFATLKRFKSREGHCRVPREHEEGGFKLGTWVVNQRNRKSALSAERKQRLNAIGFVWRLK